MTIHPITLAPGDAAQAQDLRPAGGFQVVIADPPWNFSGNSVEKPGRNARRHYPTMQLADIEALPIREIVAKDALLLLWVTVPFAEHGFRVLKAWGFRYASQLVWPKARIGTGYWARNQHELVLIGRRGRFPCTSPALFPTSLIRGPQGKHSQKPEWLHSIIEARYPDYSRAELFARRARPGWTCIGNQLTTED
jgi:N6-adenosine-specific RNA methylase IME4